MIILTEKKSVKEKRGGHLVHVNLGEVGFAINAPTREEAIMIALERAWEMVSKGTCSINIPKAVRVDGEPCQSPSISFRVASYNKKISQYG
jgi:hypothetical protein